MGDRTIVITISIDSPLGSLAVFLDVGGPSLALVGLAFSNPGESDLTDNRCLPRAARDLLETLESQLADYFSGSMREFDVAMRPRGTKFQLAVWSQLTQIPIGETISYGKLALRVGQPGGAQAVGQANKRNPIPILIPCHRVIAADGSIGGYAGGLERKEFLLDLEAAAVGASRSLFGAKA